METQLSDQNLLKSLQTSGLEKEQISRLTDLIPSLGQADREKLAGLIGRSKKLMKEKMDNDAAMAKLNAETQAELTETSRRLSKEIRTMGEKTDAQSAQEEMAQIEKEIQAQ